MAIEVLLFMFKVGPATPNIQEREQNWAKGP